MRSTLSIRISWISHLARLRQLARSRLQAVSESKHYCRAGWGSGDMSPLPAASEPRRHTRPGALRPHRNTENRVRPSRAVNSDALYQIRRVAPLHRQGVERCRVGGQRDSLGAAAREVGAPRAGVEAQRFRVEAPRDWLEAHEQSQEVEKKRVGAQARSVEGVTRECAAARFLRVARSGRT